MWQHAKAYMQKNFNEIASEGQSVIYAKLCTIGNFPLLSMYIYVVIML